MRISELAVENAHLRKMVGWPPDDRLPLGSGPTGKGKPMSIDIPEDIVCGRGSEPSSIGSATRSSSPSLYSPTHHSNNAYIPLSSPPSSLYSQNLLIQSSQSIMSATRQSVSPVFQGHTVVQSFGYAPGSTSFQQVLPQVESVPLRSIQQLWSGHSGRHVYTVPHSRHEYVDSIP